MIFAILIWRNLWRSRTRTLLTVGSLAISLFLFTLLAATVECMKEVAAESARRLRLVVHHKTTVTKLLPLSHGPRVASVPGVRTVCGMRWFGGRLENSQEQFPSMAVDPAGFPTVFSDFELTAAELADWSTRRTAAVLGVGLARRIGCTRGERVVLTGSVPPYLKLEFRVAGLTHAAAYPNVFVFRLDYLIDALRADPMMPTDHDNAVNIYWVQAESAAVLDSVRQAVDAAFANSADATRTEWEAAFVAHFTKMFGDIPRLIRKVGWIVIISILLVVCNSLSIAVGERIAELAVLKAVGFTTFGLVVLLLGEAVLMGLLGGAVCLVALLAFGVFGPAGLSMPYFPTVSVSPAVAILGVAAGVLVSLAAVALPARRVAGLSIVEVLRNLAGQPAWT